MNRNYHELFYKKQDLILYVIRIREPEYSYCVHRT